MPQMKEPAESLDGKKPDEGSAVLMGQCGVARTRRPNTRVMGPV
jgi:hypothetical protein